MNINNDNIILNTLKQAEENYNKEIPSGYIEVNLSTKGKLGAPASFHIRNFKVRDIVALSLTLDSDIPKRLIEILNEMIFEDDIDVGNFHEKEVEELMILLYINFFKKDIDLIFPYDESDMKLLMDTDPDSANALKSGNWKPSVPVDLTKSISMYDIPDDFKSKITITNKETGFHVTFDYMKYKDRLIVKSWLDSLFKDQERKFKNVKDIIARNNNTLLSGGSVKDIIYIDPEEEEEYKNYINDKFRVLTEASRLVSVVDYNGQDVSSMSLNEKYELMSNDARIDYGMIEKLAKRQQKTPIGIKPEVIMNNPFTGESCTRRLSFRVSTIIQAIQVSGDNKYDDGYDDAPGDNMV